MFENSMIADQQRHDDEGEDWLNSLPNLQFDFVAIFSALNFAFSEA